MSLGNVLEKNQNDIQNEGCIYVEEAERRNMLFSTDPGKRVLMATQNAFACKFARYLGDQFNILGTASCHIQDRIEQAKLAWGRFKLKILCRPEIPIPIKVQVFRANIISILTFGLEVGVIIEGRA